MLDRRVLFEVGKGVGEEDVKQEEKEIEQMFLKEKEQDQKELDQL